MLHMYVLFIPGFCEQKINPTQPMRHKLADHEKKKIIFNLLSSHFLHKQKPILQVSVRMWNYYAPPQKKKKCFG